MIDGQDVYCPLSHAKRATLRSFVSTGKGAARRLIHGRVLDLAICEAVAVSRATVERIRKRFVEQGLDATLDLHRPDTPREHETDGLEVGAGSVPPPPSRDRASGK